MYIIKSENKPGDFERQIFDIPKNVPNIIRNFLLRKYNNIISKESLNILLQGYKQGKKTIKANCYGYEYKISISDSIDDLL